MRTEKSSRWAAMLLATVVGVITCLAMANATQTITTPNAAFISYNLTAGANSAAITPVSSRSVLVMGCDTDGGDQGVGQVSLMLLPSGGIQWAGYESFNSLAPVTTGGATATAGAHIVFIDFTHHVEIQVASTNTIRIHNGSTGLRAGNVTLIW